ncbi:SDR family NAD(P)-dependent oxidoreductase [Variovorax sp. YR216]|uniref:SDR family NAD(P)-dependent oxidoreductase n=1 Tax=Variovorax sp. YR216 TaxID=1882828 RepID=UPI000899862F|nr:SDR family NAD(P)-dependent oxidoreductase [Variovorax sp. YR216]SEB25305.1 NAD(P)-dependent dehydrogenase, short-chain alcohol dehydrogenase family [Variovorax sp. YR216]
MRLKDKVAFITGGGAGIGAAAAVRFASEGAAVVVAEIDQARGADLAESIRAHGGKAKFVRCDVTDEASVEQAVAEGTAAFGGHLDILYNNAGGSTPHDDMVTVVDMDEFWRCIKLELLGTFLSSRFGIRAMQKAGRGGSVINTASYNATIGTSGRDCYTAAKGAVIALTRSMAVEYAPDGIRVNCIAPGVVISPRMTKFQQDFPNHRIFDKKNRHHRPEVPSHLLGPIEIEDLTHMALFLASDESKRITGRIELVDSGATAS